MIEQPMENRKWFQKRDLLLILLVGAAAAVLFFWPKEQGAAAVISQEGRELYCIEWMPPMIFLSAGNTPW